MQLDRSRELKADMMLVLVALCWGLSYIAMNQALTEVSTYTLNAYRFLGAFLLTMLVSARKMLHVNRITLWYALLVGATLALTYVGVTVGIQNTTISNSAFLCSTVSFFTPLLEWIVFRKHLSRKMKIAVGLCIVGVALLTLKDDFSINTDHLKGDLFSLLCGAAYAVDIVLTDKALEREDVDAYRLGGYSLGFCGLIMLLMALFTEHMTLPQSGLGWLAVIFLSVFCTGIAFIVQPVAQQYTEPSHVGIIFTLEPVFAGVTAFFIAGEVLSMKGYLGQILIVAALLVMEINFTSIFRKKQNDKS